MKRLFIAILISGSLATSVWADTVYLKNGRSVEGIVEGEDRGTVTLNTGFGIITLARSQIRSISVLDGQKKKALTDEWKKEQARLKGLEGKCSEERDRRFWEYAKSEEGARAKISRNNKKKGAYKVNLNKAEGSQDIFVEALLNGTTKATLILDTGSYEVVLTRRIGNELGIDFSDTENDVRQVRLAGKDRLVKVVGLSSMSVGQAQVEGILVEVLFSDEDTIGLRDGLLGMSFLNRFDSNLDLDKLKMVLKKKDND